MSNGFGQPPIIAWYVHALAAESSDSCMLDFQKRRIHNITIVTRQNQRLHR
jgi:hypothetical protein